MYFVDAAACLKGSAKLALTYCSESIMIYMPDEEPAAYLFQAKHWQSSTEPQI
jgi:hypothetical protein